MLSTDASPGSGLTAQYQSKFNSDLLERAIQLTVMDQFSQKESFPKNAGAKTMTFFRQTSAPTSRSANASTGGEVQTLTEGTLITTSGTIGYNTVLATMVQYGNVLEFSDIVGMTALFNALNGVKDRIAETAALHADDIVRNIICGSGTTGSTPAGAFVRIYAQGAASLAALNSAAVSSSTLTVNDMLRAFTRLKVNRAPMKNGRYYLVAPPEVTYDLMNDPKWLNIGYYQDKTQYVKGEVGQLYGIRVVETTNSFIQNTAGTEGTFTTTGTNGYISLAVGSNAFGTPIMAGQSPYSPAIQVVNTPDKLDVLNQITAVGWKAYWCAVTLNTTWGISICSKTSYS